MNVLFSLRHVLFCPNHSYDKVKLINPCLGGKFRKKIKNLKTKSLIIKALNYVTVELDIILDLKD